MGITEDNTYSKVDLTASHDIIQECILLHHLENGYGEEIMFSYGPRMKFTRFTYRNK